jgi:hypothetical protein
VESRPSPAVNSLVTIRVPNHAHQPSHEYASRIAELAPDAVVVSVPPGANSALLASGTREIELSWTSPRGEYEQSCRLVYASGAPGDAKQWRLRPLGRPVLIQRRRYIRVRASVDVTVDVLGETLAATTVDVSEGGFRVRVARCDVGEVTRTVVRTVIAGAEVAIAGNIIRTAVLPTADAEGGNTELVVAFEADGTDAEAVRRFVLHMQLRARANLDS